MAYPYTEADYARLMAAAAAETKAQMQRRDMIDGTKTRTDLAKKVQDVLGAMREVAAPVTAEEVADTMASYSIKVVRQTIRHLSETGAIREASVKRHHIYGGCLSKTYVIAGECHG